MTVQRFVLVPEERNSALIKKLAKYYEDRLDSLRTRNDGDLSETETAKYRGRIAEVKAFLALCKEPVAHQDDKQ